MQMSSPSITDYDQLCALGSGSYSTVFKARHKKTKKCVAIKSVAKNSLSKSSTDNLLREIKILKTLKHKYIVEMVDFTWDDKNIYIIMELCEKGDLSAYIRQHKQLPESTCKFFLRQLAIALKYMRENNVSHFDLKPQNLLLTRNPGMTLKVADFGFAQHIGLLDKNTTIKGSPLYMAPEILLNHCYDPSADLWSIGVILYECLFGAAPYRSKSMEELLLKIKTKQHIDIPKTKLSAACSHLLARLLVHEPKDRITFVDFFAHEFLDMTHEPTSENLGKAIRLITDAIELDNREKYVDAYALYCEGLEYFVPLITAETDPLKKRQLQENAHSYLRRAEEIKLQSMQIATTTTHCSENAPKTCSVKDALNPTTTFAKLYTMCASSPQIQSGLEIGRQAELYLGERNLELAIENFRKALGSLVPLLRTEPVGLRKDLLHRLISDWMVEAEQIKSLLAVKNLPEVSEESASAPASNLPLSNCSLQ